MVDEKKPTHTKESDAETLWYLAYGSNMDPRVLTGRRKIQPLESKTVVVPEYWLSFDVGGIPFIEPCFASILKRDQSKVHERDYALFVHERCRYGQQFVWHEDQPEQCYPPVLQGVVHKITHREWQLIVQSEGGLGHDVPTGYDHIEVECKVVNSDEHVFAHVLTARPLSISTRCQPSARYKSLLTAGAAHHNLDPAYQEYLLRILPYECTGLRSLLARLVFVIFNIPMLLAYTLLLKRNKGVPADQRIPPPYWMAWYFDKASRFSNAAHDNIVAPIFGSGRCSTLAQQAVIRKRIDEELRSRKTQEQHQECQEREAEKEPELMKVAEKIVESTAE
ncbi:hypothetical protein BGX28_005903 [Mortierella sp. GBA30]|nr:hypothetical protein BGX28_005903 [Mortierella sp. GBA30]